MKQLYTFIFIIFSLQAVAQTPTTGARPQGGGFPAEEKIGYGKISGKIIDGDKAPVPYAAVALIDQKNQKTVDGTVADENGAFTIKNIVEGSYKVSISFIGFEAIEMGPYAFTGKGNTYDLGVVTMTTSTVQLDEVVVEGERDLIEDKVDRIVYNAEQDKTTVGGDATDVLRRVPLLSVDLDGNVSLRGSSNITVLIDGRPSTISASSIADALKQIPADQIKSVEVITSPSARYDAEGTGGIINIITKKNDLQGGSLSINSSAGLRGSNIGLNASYRKGRMGVNLGGFGRSGYNIVGEFDNEQILKDEFGNVTSVTRQMADTRNNMLMGRYNLGWDYAINKYNWIGASANLGLFNFKMAQDGRTTNTVSESGSRSTLEDVSMDNLSNTVDVSMNYIKTFEEQGKEISLLSLYSQNKRTNDFDIETLMSDVPVNFDNIRNENDSYNREFTIQLDYVEPIGDKVIFETGAKNISRDVTSEFQFLAQDESGVWVPSDRNQLNNDFDYNQNVTSGYVSGTFELPKGFTAKVGGRYEYTTITANFSDEAEIEIPDYGVFVPSINLSKKIKGMNTVKFAYSRRIQRPSLQFLNPNIEASNPLNISQGNPNLDPEYTNNFEVSYSTFKDGTSVNISAFMRNTTGSIQQVRETLGADTIYTTYENIGEEDAYGVSVFANTKFGKFSFNGGVDAYYAILDNNVEDPIYNASNEGFVVSGRLFGSYEFTDQWALQFFSFVRGNQVQLQGSQTGFYIYSLSLNRQFKEKKGSIGFGAENFLGRGMKMTSEINSPLIDQSSTMLMRNMNFKVNFSYRIGKLTTGQSRKKMKKIENNDLKDGGGSQDSMNQ
jgi:outer membrane receptor protein involved in Fe transport